MPQPSDGDLGSLVSEYREGETEVRLYLHGFAIEQRASSFRGHFRELAMIYGEEAAAVPGSGARFRLVIATHPALRAGAQPDRREFRLVSSAAAASTLRGLLRMSAPVIVERAHAQFKAGEVVDFGAVRLSESRIFVRRMLFGWRKLPVDRISGWVVRDGWLFLDADPHRPIAFAEKPVAQIANLAALTALLIKIRAEADLSQPANSLRHEASAHKRPWNRPTALTRKPGVSFARFGVILAIWAVVIGLGFVASRHPVVARVGRRFIADLAEAVRRLIPR